MKVTRRVQPLGEKGIFLSLEEVAKKAGEGGTRPDVRRWAIDQLDKVRKTGRNVHAQRDQAEILLAAVQEKLWISDPVGTEFIQGAHMTACTPESDMCFAGGDCDDLTVLLAAACLSIGIDTVIVGHSYNNSRQISHVLCAVFFDNTWHYADASIYNGDGDHYPLGKCGPFTRETLHELPSAKLLCDENACLTLTHSPDPYATRQWDQGGIFVGVDGHKIETPPLPKPEDFAYRIEWISPQAGRLQALGASEAEEFAADTDWEKFADDKAYREERIKEGAGLAAAGACAAMGAPAAAPLCSAAGSYIAGTAIKVWNSVFGNSAEVQAALQRRKDAHIFFAGQDRAQELSVAVYQYLQGTLIALAEFDKEVGSNRYISGTTTFLDSWGLLTLVDAIGPCLSMRGTAMNPSMLRDELEITEVGKYRYCGFKPGKGADLLGYYWDRHSYHYTIVKFSHSVSSQKAIADAEKMADYLVRLIKIQAGQVMMSLTTKVAAKKAAIEAGEYNPGKLKQTTKPKTMSTGAKVAVAATAVAAIATAVTVWGGVKTS